MYRDLRAMALGAVLKGLQPPRADHPDVSGVVIDIPGKGGYSTLVSLTDDTTSMYTTTGGGAIGAGGHVAVALATHSLLAAIDQQLAQFTSGEVTAMPPPGTVRFHVLAPAGGRPNDREL